MNIQEIVAILVNSGIEPNEARIEVKLMIEHYCNYSALDVIRGVPLDYEKLKVVREKAEFRAKSKIPIQHIIGLADFLGNKYIVNENVLIPRDETEQLVLKVIDAIRANKYKSVLDIGTGSGCIPCAIAQSVDCDITSVDISSKAIEVARKNAENLGVDKKVRFLESDLFLNLNGEKFDVIVSNPPYIPNGVELQTEVQFEPQNALFTTDSRGLEFYQKIIPESLNHLNDNGFLAFEIGYDQGQEVHDLFVQAGFKDVIIEKDMQGLDRIVYGKFVNREL